jgi:hypothetical protein
MEKISQENALFTVKTVQKLAFLAMIHPLDPQPPQVVSPQGLSLHKV